jgi:hypothetical protein
MIICEPHTSLTQKPVGQPQGMTIRLSQFVICHKACLPLCMLIAPVIVANTLGKSNLGRVSSHKSFLQNLVWVSTLTTLDNPSCTRANEIGIQENQSPAGRIRGHSLCHGSVSRSIHAATATGRSNACAPAPPTFPQTRMKTSFGFEHHTGY